VKGIHHIIVSSAETMNASNHGFDTVNMHRFTTRRERLGARCTRGQNMEVSETCARTSGRQRFLLVSTICCKHEPDKSYARIVLGNVHAHYVSAIVELDAR